MPGEVAGGGEAFAAARVPAREGLLARVDPRVHGEVAAWVKRLPHPACLHWNGFSPVWVRMCLVSAGTVSPGDARALIRNS